MNTFSPTIPRATSTVTVGSQIQDTATWPARPRPSQGGTITFTL